MGAQCVTLARAAADLGPEITVKETDSTTPVVAVPLVINMQPSSLGLPSRCTPFQWMLRRPFGCVLGGEPLLGVDGCGTFPSVPLGDTPAVGTFDVIGTPDVVGMFRP
ncbi:hypothetical protein [Streptosporangium sp. NPDC006007]|uniref:hypothetical protein n=1 Tax=Streptosporangium sp. NPDC006007 TaxID=3154575 RepID=UPI0033A54CF2